MSPTPKSLPEGEGEHAFFAKLATQMKVFFVFVWMKDIFLYLCKKVTAITVMANTILAYEVL